jgi:hypothetical protein
MNRFMGMMPLEVKKKNVLKLMNQLVVKNTSWRKWTIIYADSSSEYKDEVNTTDENFKKAMEVLNTHLGCEQSWVILFITVS